MTLRAAAIACAVLLLSGCQSFSDMHDVSRTPPKQIGPETWIVQGFDNSVTPSMSRAIETRVIREKLCPDNSFQILQMRQTKADGGWSPAIMVEGTVKCVPPAS